MRSNGSRLTVAGGIRPVIRCSCTEGDLIEVPPEGWGVGAGGFGAAPHEVLPRIADSTFLFSTAFISRFPGRDQCHASRSGLEEARRAHFAPTMVSFAGGPPDDHFGLGAETSQTALLEHTIWPASSGASAVGVVALVETSRDRIAGALICRPVAAGGADIPAGLTTTDPELRPLYFDLDPLRHRTNALPAKLAWLVGTSIRNKGPNAASQDVRARFAGTAPAALPSYTHHCHLVFVDHAPETWVRGDTAPDWDTLARIASTSVTVGAREAFPIHSDGDTAFRPLLMCVWRFNDQDIAVTG
jgi:hypothetical protein